MLHFYFYNSDYILHYSIVDWKVWSYAWLTCSTEKGDGILFNEFKELQHRETILNF